MKIFEGKIEPGDIIQQALGDCYFLAGIATLAEYPHRIRNLFLTPEVNDSNHFQIKLLYKGTWRIITLDEHIPGFQEAIVLQLKDQRDLGYPVGKGLG